MKRAKLNSHSIFAYGVNVLRKVVFSLLLLTFFNPIVQAQTIVANGHYTVGSAGDFPNLPAAITALNAASNFSGVVFTIIDPTITIPLQTITKSVTIEGAAANTDGSPNTIIYLQGGASNRHFKVSGSSTVVTFKGLAIIGPNANYSITAGTGVASPTGSTLQGGGIESASSGGFPSSITIDNCVVAGCNASALGSPSSNGGGINLNGSLTSQFVLKNVVVVAYNNALQGGGIYFNTAINNSIQTTSLLVKGNAANSVGGGIFLGGALSPNPSATLTFTTANHVVIDSNTTVTGGGGIYADNNGNLLNLTGVTITNNKTTGASSYGGGGIATKSDLNVNNCTIIGNSSVYYGGGIHQVITTTNAVIANSIISNNSTSSNNSAANLGGGIYAAGTITLNNTSVSNNTAKSSGGGIYALGTLVLNNDSISNNKAGFDAITSVFLGTASNGGAVYASAGLTLQGSIIFNRNMASGGGGALWKINSGTFNTTALTNITVDSNIAINASGGGLYSHTAFSLKNATITNNISGDRGGGIMSDSIALTLTDAVISGNKAGYDYVSNTFLPGQYNGGGIYAYGALTLIGSIKFEDNKAANEGGALWKIGTSAFTTTGLTSLIVNHNSTNAGEGGGIYSLVTLNLSGVPTVTITNNSAASNGGGIRSGGGAILTLNGGTISNNTSKGSGGGIFANGNAVLSNLMLSNNIANVSGGGIYANGTTTTLSSMTVSGNTARNSGGGIYAVNALTLNNNVTVFNNRAGYDVATGNFLSAGNGGGVYAANALTLTGNIVFEKDSAAFSGGGIYHNGVLDGTNLTSLLIKENIALGSGGGGGGMYSAQDLTISNATFTGNRTIGQGGGLWVGDFVLTLKGNMVFERNTAESNGGGLFKSGGGSIDFSELTSLRVEGNATGNSGGGIYTNAALSVPAAVAPKFINNMAKNSGGGIFSANTLTLTNATFTDNKAAYDYTNITSPASGNGGGIFKSGTSALTLTKTTFSGNIAINGGGVWDASSSTSLASTFINCTFSKNQARTSNGNGGGLYLSVVAHPVNLAFSTFNGNTAGTSVNTANALFLNGSTDKTLIGNLIYGNGSSNEIYSPAAVSGIYNLVREDALTPTPVLTGSGNKGVVSGQAGNIFAAVNGDTAILANNGGYTQTLKIIKGGFAHNLFPVDSADKYGVTTNLDQRDSLRPVGCSYDAGSVELQTADSDPDGTYLLKYNAINNPLVVCGPTQIDADSLFTTTNIKDTAYFSDKNYTVPMTASPFLINGGAKAKDTIIYVKFTSTSNCELRDSIKIKYYPIPTASFVNDTVVCIDYNASLKIKLTGVIPFTFTYLNPQGNPVTINNYNDTIYTIPVFNVHADSTFTLVSVTSGPVGCSSSTFAKASATVAVTPKPVVAVTASAGISNLCYNNTINLTATPTPNNRTATFAQWATVIGAEHASGSFDQGTPMLFNTYTPSSADAGKTVALYIKYQDNICVGYYAYDTVRLRILPITTNAKMAIEAQPVTSQDICQDTVYIVKIKATDSGAVKNITLKLNDNNNSNIKIKQAEVKQPYNAASWSAPLAFLNASNNSWIVSDSLAGQDSLQVRITVAAECNFASGKTMQFEMSAQTVCGDLINGIPSLTTGIFRTDQDLSSINTFSINGQFSIDTVKNNTSDTVTWTLRAIVGGTAVTDSANETMHVRLPNGLTPVLGSYTPIQNAPVPSSQLPPVNYGSGIELRIPVKSGLTGGDTIIASLKFTTTQADCNGYELGSDIKYYDSVNCGGNSCVASQTLSSYKDSVWVERYLFSNIADSGFCENNLWTGIISITAVNPTYVGDTILIDFYKDMNNDGILNAGDVLSAQYNRPTIGVPSGTKLPLSFTGVPFAVGHNLLAVAYGKALCDSIVLPIVTITGPNVVCQGDTVFYEMPAGMQNYQWFITRPTAVDATSGASPNRFIPEGSPGYDPNPDNYNYSIAHKIGVRWGYSKTGTSVYGRGTYGVRTSYSLPGATIDNFEFDYFAIQVNPRPRLYLSKSDTTICFGNALEISHFFKDSLNIMNSSAVGSYTYYKKESNGSYTLLANQTPPIIENPSTTTTYGYYATCNSGCNAYDTIDFTVKVNQLPTAVFATTALTVCAGTDTAVMVNFTGKPPFNFTYNNGSGNITLNGINSTSYKINILNPTANAVYSLLSVSDSNNCSNTPNGTLALTVNPLPVTTITGSSAVCLLDTVTYTTADAMSSYTWEIVGGGTATGHFTSDTNMQIVKVVWTSEGSAQLKVTFTNTNGCQNSITSNILVNELPEATVSYNDDEICQGDEVELTISLTNGNSSVWSVVLGEFVNNVETGTITTGFTNASETTKTIVVSPLVNTVYKIKSVTDGNGCTKVYQ